jgi:hypothetical protein
MPLTAKRSETAARHFHHERLAILVYVVGRAVSHKPRMVADAYGAGARPTLRACAKEFNALMRDQRAVIEELRT